MSLPESTQIERLTRQVDRLLAEVSALRRQIASLGKPAAPGGRSVRQSVYFGMWANRDDLQGRSSREWLDEIRAQQWRRS